MTETRIERVTIFCGSSAGDNKIFRQSASDLGRRLALEKITVIYGGGRTGMMGALADGALEANGKVIGVIPRFLLKKELGHQTLTELYTVETMHERKTKMFELSDAFITMPGGIGTLEETFEIITWRQLQRHNKPIFVLNIGNYWKNFGRLMADTVRHKFSKPGTLQLYKTFDEVDSLINELRI